ncbi:MAG: tRNA pseudouridine(55) synthase TruB [Candidatus Harrisonbacteria bacterium RIFCSPLOWO2_02_FULL_41_11]|uniref:tRNA pseudouridine synthase B n=1 Tax=Candidatus Harrisonbacteria bacterium RIFCSPHIGHO2_02_FULL_42_16 TaxID=1798404 RepID=A0A1G1ZH06_9BACT|nr:MAG: tRNA pseudouridine(55) synthase TruB [Candidatus Harrisonbacteria bacterium RIFCSPHIGHO2_02_FULL_42_16]OGY66731.1 MAG: tRNA pseudouridine(55) synthase TruB [Candidatus Harrisonbacteria bacterium RIFCSPLOWO2_02_FULL_41_11]
MNLKIPKSGIFAVYKPKGPTSHDMVEKIRKLTGEKRVGHAGTLDPLASGVLVIGVGREATKKLSEAVKKEKEYIAEIKLGVESATDDEEGEKYQIIINQFESADRIKKSDIEKAIQKFVGKIEQVPPVYSAVKIRGKEAYKRVRRGEKVALKSRAVEIKEIELLEYKWPNLKIRVVTGPGVYIRALARDIGKILEVGAYLSDLERTRVGEFTKSESAIV